MNAGPFVLVIFGATGDLATNKLLPALYTLFQKNVLGDNFYIVGFSRRDFTDEQYRDFVAETLKVDAPSVNLSWGAFSKNIYYQKGIFDDVKGYEELISRLNTFDEEVGACITRLFYLATPPDNYDSILNHLNETKLSEGCGQGSEKWTRIAIEKPFGKDLDHARALDRRLSEIFIEKQIYRVDHYLAKDTVQNLIAFRFANSIFEPVWNKTFVDHVQITMSETVDLSTRGKFFDGVGNLRDVGQNHVLQLAASIVMDQPKSFSREGVRDARAEAIRAIRPIRPDEVAKYIVRGQYEGYREEKNVDPQSDTETFFAMKAYFDTQRFYGVPFYFRAGKKMAKDLVEISIVFVQTCHILFKEYGCPAIGNVLTIRIQPDEGIRLRVIAKKPGTKVALDPVDMKFTYKEAFGGEQENAYEKVLLDILAGDQMLFNRSDELESSWSYITNILNGWKTEKPVFPNYTAGSWGPKESVELIENDGRTWF